MLKLISFPLLMLTALVIMGRTKSSLLKTTGDPATPLPTTAFHKSPVSKAGYSLNAPKPDFYKLWQLDHMGLSKKAFTYAMQGFGYLNKKNLIAKENIVSIVDFSKPSTQKRLYVIDVSNGKILFNTWVAHGRNSGDEYASKFSNLPESHQTSLGFYVTMETYTGENGYSLRLKGCEKGINDKAYERAIVIHGADYVSGRFINNTGVLGRSYSCPAIPAGMSKKIIDAIKNGSCLFLYHPTKKYCKRSKILNRQV